MASDYHLRLDEAITTWFNFHDLGGHCKYLNVSTCILANSSSTSDLGNQFDVWVYNPLGHRVSTLTRFPVVGNYWRVHNQDEPTTVISQQTLQVADSVKRIPGRSQNGFDYELIFETGDLEPLSYKKFTFSKVKSKYVFCGKCISKFLASTS